MQETKTTFISVGHPESLFNYHQWVLELSQDSSWQLLTVQDYRLQKAKQITTNSPKNAQIPIDVLPKSESQSQSEIGTILGLSHKEMQALTDSPINTVRSKASLSLLGMVLPTAMTKTQKC